LRKLAVQHDNLCGGEFHLPDPLEPQHYDASYRAIVLPYRTNAFTFTRANPERPMTKLVADQVIDLCVLDAGPSAALPTEVTARCGGLLARLAVRRVLHDDAGAVLQEVRTRRERTTS
jgi:hypothetical protein